MSICVAAWNEDVEAEVELSGVWGYRINISSAAFESSIVSGSPQPAAEGGTDYTESYSTSLLETGFDPP